MRFVHYAALAAVLALAVAGCGAEQSGQDSGAARAIVASTTSAAGSPDPHEAATVDHVNAVLAATPAFPGAVRVNSSPDPALGDPPGVKPPTFVQRTTWWTSPMTSDEFHGWLREHLPAGWSTQGNQDPVGDWGADGFLEQYAAGPRNDAVWTYSAADVYWIPSGKGIAIRVSAQADWVATRQAAEHIADDATTVDVSVFVKDPTRSNTDQLQPTVHRTITGPNAAKLRDAVNRLNPWTDTGLHGCLADFGMTDVLVFRGGPKTTTITTYGDGCTGSTFVAGGKTFPPLEDSVLHTELVQMLHLPTDYLTYW